MKKLSVRSAFAELTVIVLGVLIALLAENAWNDHKDRVEGRVYISRLSAELESNLKFLNNDKVWAQLACYSTEAALTQIRDTENAPDPALTLRLVVSAATYPSPEYQRITLDDLIATGNLSLIDDTLLREQIVSVYTDFFEDLNAWRPPKVTELRKTAVRTLPSEYIVRVISDCLINPDTGRLSSTMRACKTIPSSKDPDFWLEKLMARPDLEGALSERAWQACDFGRSMASVQDRIETLIVKLDTFVE